VDRQWHDYGSYDFFGTGHCVNYGTPTADMPSGWLAVRHNAGNAYIVTAFVPHGYAAPTSCDEGAYAGFGLVPAFWKTDKYGYDNYVCEWSVFSDWVSPGTPGATQRYGWWYAIPFWPSRDALPNNAGAMYVKLDVIDYDSLVYRWAPHIRLDSQEPYRPQAIEGILSVQGTGCDNGPTGSNSLMDLTAYRYYSTIADCSSDLGHPALSADDLVASGYSYPSYANSGPSSSDYINERESNVSGDTSTYQDDSHWVDSFPGWNDQIYGRSYQDAAGKVWLEYWFWYYFNDGEGVVDNHEGDWEGIFIRMKSDLSGPSEMTYRQHDVAERCPSYDVEYDGPVGDAHPMVYPALGRHASYFAGARYWSHTSGTAWSSDYNDGQGVLLSPHVNLITTYTPGWMRWPGHWGGTIDSGQPFTGDSPPGPQSQDDFNDPQGKEDGAVQDYCVDAPVSTASARRRSHHRHESRGSYVPTPKISATRSGHEAFVRYRVPQSAHPIRLLVSTHASNPKVAPTSRWVMVKPGSQGRVRVPLPLARGLYAVKASLFARRGRSHVINVPIG
jgi:hypothetical protein